MKRITFFSFAGGAVLASAAVCAPQAQTVDGALQSLTDAIVNGQVNLGVRYRYEHVTQDRPAGILHHANAQTVRSNLGWRTGLFHGFSAYAEVENVSVVGDEDYNNTYNGETAYPVVADPDGTEVNQAYLTWQGVAGNQLRYGRQAIVFDNARFVGDVGWRQNQQTLDGFSYQNTMLEGVTASYAYIYNVNRIFGEDTPNKAFGNIGDFQLDGHLINVQWKPNATTTLTGYAYLLDFDDFDAESTATYGLRATGAVPLPQLGIEGAALLYTAEYAHQTDYADNPGDFGLGYGSAELGLRLFGVTAKAGYERLEGGEMGGTRALQTPLATLHAFNGWTDRFLSTPAAGLEDRYVLATGVLPGCGVNWLVRYDDFSAEAGSDDYGSEWGVQLTKTFAKHYTVGVKYADYDTDAPALLAGRADTTDTAKGWFWLQMNI